MNVKRIIAMILALSLCLCLAACGGSGDSEGTAGVKLGENEAQYKVSVVDPLGNPYTSGIIARFMQNGQQVSMQVANENGVAEKILEKGDYTVELQFTDKTAAYYYDTEGLTLSADKTELAIELSHAVSGEAETLYAHSLVSGGKADCQAYSVGVGCTYVELTVDERNYFLFAPTEAGTYEFSVLEGEAEIGYYGSTYFVQDYTTVEPVDGVIGVSIRADMIGTDGSGTNVLVIGLDAKTENAILAVERVGDPQYTIADEPWTEYPTTHTPEAFTLDMAAGQTLTYVDITAKTADYQVVLGSDGFYHLGTADGPLMYVNLGKEAPNLSLEIMINGDGVAGGAPLRKYFYDENGEFVKKEDYTEIMLSYFECADEDLRVYPLTEDLAYMIRNGGEGWWDPESPNYLFEGCNPELGWLFACCYVK